MSWLKTGYELRSYPWDLSLFFQITVTFKCAYRKRKHMRDVSHDYHSVGGYFYQII